MDKPQGKKEDCKGDFVRRESKIFGFSNKIFKAQISSS